MTDPRIEKLPKWARDHIGRLEKSLEAHKDRLKKVTGQWPDSRVTIRGVDFERLQLPDFETIEFATQKGNVAIRYEPEQDYLVVSGNYHGDDRLSVFPGASNMVYIRIGR